MEADQPLLRIRGLTRRHRRRGGWRGAEWIEALAGVDLDLARGAALALVGPSGSGKSTLARCVARLEEPTSGEIRFEDADVLALRGPALGAFRQRVQLVLQDSAAALDPRLTALESVAEPLEILGRGGRDERRRRARELIESVGLPADVAARRPLDLSGGQRQRVAIARGLAVQPRLLVLDEAFTGLDVSVQAQIASLLADLRRRHGLTYLFVSHDLPLMSLLAEEVAILSEGRIVERTAAAEIFIAPRHPQTRALVAAVAPLPDLEPPRAPGPPPAAA